MVEYGERCGDPWEDLDMVFVFYLYTRLYR